MAEQPFEIDLNREVIEKIIKSGWHSNELIKEPKVSFQGLRLIPDFILVHEWYPLALVEVKRQNDLTELNTSEQAKSYAYAVGLQIVIVTDGSKHVSLNINNKLTKSWGDFPSPQDLWEWLGRNSDSTDPRLYPALPSSSPPKWFQALALGRALDALVSGSNRGIILLSQGSGSTAVIMQLIHKLIHSGFFQRLLYVSERQEDLTFLTQIFEDNKESSFILNKNKPLNESHPIHLVHMADLVELNSLLDSSQKGFKFYDIIFTRNGNAIDKLIGSLDHLSQSSIFVFPPFQSKELKNFPDQPIFEYSLQNTVSDISLPKGFKPVLLGDISEIDSGLSFEIDKTISSKRRELLRTNKAYLISGRDILDDGTIDFKDVPTFDPKESFGWNVAQAGDILMSREISHHTYKKVAIVPNNIDKTVLLSDNIIRIRVDPTKAKPSDVVDFLISDSGQELVKRFAWSIAGMPIFSPMSLMQVPVFLPEIDGTDNVKELSTTAAIIHQLKEEIIPSLEKLDQSAETDDIEIEVIAQQLRRMANTLVPLPLAERVISKYPTPIALAYKRFCDSKFNVYEQVQRLRDVYEATSFFVYNLVLADILRRLDPKTFFITDARSRRAYNGYSMATRIDLVKEVINIARSNSNQELFIPEIVDSDFLECGELLQNLRNSWSHTATATESKQRQILSEFKPIVEALLSRIDFFENYRLVRVPSFHRKDGQLTYRMEVYQGTVPNLDEQAASKDSPLEELGTAEYNHLVMLNNSGKILDLYPLYQLVEDNQTQYESHICFFKQCKLKDRKLEGESIINSKVIYLEGFNEFERLQSNILEKAPEKSI